MAEAHSKEQDARTGTLANPPPVHAGSREVCSQSRLLLYLSPPARSAGERRVTAGDSGRTHSVETSGRTGGHDATSGVVRLALVFQLRVYDGFSCRS